MRAPQRLVVGRIAVACLVAAGVVAHRANGDDGGDGGDAAAADAAGRAFVEIVTARGTCYVHERVRLRLRVGFDAAYFRTNVVATYRREMDVPLHVRTPWFRDLPGTLPLPAPAVEGDRRRLSFALDDTVTAAARADDVLRDGRTWTVLEVERDVLPTTPGELVVPGPLVRFSFGTKFEDDLVNGRVAIDRREAGVEGAPLKLQVLPLPAEGRPPEFAGAVGRFAVEAASGARDVEVGQSLKLILRIAGEGNLATFDAPRLDGLAGFHVYGSLDDHAVAGVGAASAAGTADAAHAANVADAAHATHRTITYDIAPLGADVTAVPPITFAYFDPRAPAGYRTARTQPIPLTVRPRSDAAGGSLGGAGTDPTADASTDGGANSRGTSPSRALVAVLVVAALLSACALVIVRRTIARRAADPARARALGAAAAFRARMATPGSDPADAFAQFLAAHLGCPTASVISPDLAARLTAAGVPADLAVRAGAVLERLVAARYGGAARGDESGGSPADRTPDLVDALVEALDVSFRERAGGG